MTQEQNVSEKVDTDAQEQNSMTLEQALEKVKTLESQFQEAVSTRDKAKQKLRTLETEAGQAAELAKKFDEVFAEKNKLHEELTGLKDGIKQESINKMLTVALEAAGARSVSTVLKLIDRSKIQYDDKGQVVEQSIADLIDATQSSDPILFGEVQKGKSETNTETGSKGSDPGVRRAGEASTEGAFEREMKATKSQQQIEAVLRKYGKL